MNDQRKKGKRGSEKSEEGEGNKSENGQSSETIPANIFPRPSSLSAILILSEKVNRTLDNESILNRNINVIIEVNITLVKEILL